MKRSGNTAAKKRRVHKAVTKTRAKQSKRPAQKELAAELAAMIRLHQLSTKLLAKDQLQPLLEEVLDATIDLLGADFGNIQLYIPQSQALEIVAQRGFGRDFLDYFKRVDDAHACCGRAMLSRERVIIEDVLTDAAFAPHRAIAVSTGFRAVQSTPLFSRSGEPLGMISTHFRQPHRPRERDLRFVDLYARQAAELIERERAEEALRQSEKKFAVVFEKATLAMALARLPDGELVDVNEEWINLFGFTKKEATGKTSVELGINRDTKKRVRIFRDIQERGFLQHEIGQFFNRRGEPLIVDCNMRRVTLGAQKYLLSTMHDVTEQKRAEEKLRRSEIYLTEGQRLSHTASWAWHVSTGEVFWSEELFRIYGLDPGKPNPQYPEVLSCVHPDDQARVQKTFEDAVRDQKEYELAYRVVRSDGTTRHVNNLAHPVFDDAGALVEYVGTTIDTTERIHAEEALRASEERFRRYFDLGLIGMAITSPTKGILEVNDELCRILGYERSELLQLSWAEMTHPDDLAADVAQFERVLAGEIDGYSLEKRWLRKDERVIYSIMSAKCQRRGDGSIDYFVGLVLDISGRKRAEDAQRKLAALVENSRDFIGIATLEGDVLYVNRAGRKLVGLNGEESTTIWDYVMESDRAFVAEELLPQVAELGTWEGEMSVRHFQTGSPIPMHMNVFLIKEEGTDRALALATISRDITERKAAEEKLAESERRFRLLAETLPQQVWSYSPDGSANYFNRRWLDYTGISSEQARRNSGQEIVHPDDLPAIEMIWREATEKGKPFETELRLRGKDGEYRRFFIQGAPFLSDTGEVLEWHGTNTDIEDRKQAEEALQEAQSRLEKVRHVSAMGEMAAAIAHEINQPLGAIVNNSAYCLQLLGKPAAEAKERATLADIASDANRASAIIGRIRGLTNGSTPEITKLNFPELIAEVMTLAQRGLTEHRIEVKTGVARNLPRMSGDRVHLQQVLLNLVVNAVEAMSRVEGRARLLTIQAARTTLDGNLAIAVTVTDTGSGFGEEAAERMFDAFYSTKPAGMGMGLRISRTIVEGHGGRLSATRNEGEGAKFCFVLPVEKGWSNK